jgi:hypothetical protein
MKKLPGTILPTKESLKIADEMYLKDKLLQVSIARERGLKNGLKQGLETRYNEGNFYRIVGMDGRVRLFERRKDGDYFVKFD